MSLRHFLRRRRPQRGRADGDPRPRRPAPGRPVRVRPLAGPRSVAVLFDKPTLRTQAPSPPGSPSSAASRWSWTPGWPGSARGSRSPTSPGCWAGRRPRSSGGPSGRTTSRRWPPTRASRCADLLCPLLGGDLAQHGLRAPLGDDLGDCRPVGETWPEVRHAVLPARDHRLDELELGLDVRVLVDLGPSRDAAGQQVVLRLLLSGQPTG